MSTPNDGGPAFPHPELVQDVLDEEGHVKAHRVYHAQPGMTLRDYFAAKALPALWGNDNIRYDCAKAAKSDEHAAELLCQAAWRVADLMLSARDKKEGAQ